MLGDMVTWDFYAGLDPDDAIVLVRACLAMDTFVGTTPAAEPEPAPEPGETPGALCNNPHFYVGVTRYAARRWLGGDHLRPEDGHRANWRKMHILAAYSLRIGDHEEYLIQALRRCYGELRCVNARGGGGGTLPYKPSMLYFCTGRRGRR